MKIESRFGRRHPEDEFFDAIVLRDPKGVGILRIGLRERYKTSGLSGDEWRFSAMWQIFRGDSWEDLDGPYRDIETGCAAIYNGIWTSHPDLHDTPCAVIHFMHKGQIGYAAHYENKIVPLLGAVGCLPWALIHARENCGPIREKDKCFQPACPRDAVSTYILKETFSSSGEGPLPREHGFIYYRQFCERHLRRGDCSREDSDDNYIVESGPGPSENDWTDARISESQFGGVIDMGGIKP